MQLPAKIFSKDKISILATDDDIKKLIKNSHGLVIISDSKALKRSIAQNRLMFRDFSIIQSYTGLSKDEILEATKYAFPNYFPEYEIFNPITCEPVPKRKGTSDLDRDSFCKFVEEYRFFWALYLSKYNVAEIEWSGYGDLIDYF